MLNWIHFRFFAIMGICNLQKLFPTKLDNFFSSEIMHNLRRTNNFTHSRILFATMAIP